MASQTCGSTALSFAVRMSVYMTAARSKRCAPIRRIATTFCPEPNRAGRARQHCWRGRSSHQATREASEGLPVRQHVVDRFSYRDVSREFGALGAHPSSSAATVGALVFSRRPASRFSTERPLLISVFDAEERVDVLTASPTVIFEIGGAFLPGRAFATRRSANSKNFRRAWLQAQSPRQLGQACGRKGDIVEAVRAIERVGLQNAGA